MAGAGSPDTVALIARGPAYYTTSVRKCYRTKARAEAWLAEERREAQHGHTDRASLGRLYVVTVPAEGSAV